MTDREAENKPKLVRVKIPSVEEIGALAAGVGPDNEHHFTANAPDASENE